MGKDEREKIIYPHRDRVNGRHSDIRDARWAVDGVENKT